MLAQFLNGHNGLDFFLLALAALAMPVLSAFTGRQLATPEERKVPLIRRYWLTIMRGWIVVALIIFAWASTERPFTELGLDIPVGFWGKIGFALVGLAAITLFAQLARLPKLVGRDLDKWAGRMEELRITPRTRDELFVFIPVAITAGIWEELLYRGFFIWFLLPVTGAIGAAAISSAIFGIGHIYQGWRGVLNTGLIGLLFAAFFLLTQSLWWLMAAHALVDIYGGLLAYKIVRMCHEAGAAAPA